MKCLLCKTHQAAPGFDVCALCSVDEFYKIPTVGEQKDIVVTINHDYNIDFIQKIEDHIDDALAPLGFSRSTTHHEPNSCSLIYFQFGKAL